MFFLFKDRIFRDKKKYPKKFRFNMLVAKVFDNMIKRSVPFYNNIQDSFCYFAKIFIRPGTNIYDLGCSTGYTLQKIATIFFDKNVIFFAVDYAQPMLDKAKRRLRKFKCIEYLRRDLNNDLVISNASMVIANLVFQFLKYSARLRLLKKIYTGLRSGGALLLVEKVSSENVFIDHLFMEKYIKFKEGNGYSRQEISRKRDALKNILVPLSMEQNLDLLKKAGFKKVDVFYRWFNFCGFLAIK